MKPPKSIRNLVNSLLGKKSKSTIKSSVSFDTSTTSLDKDGRHHRSADDLLEENSIALNSNRLPYVSTNNRSRSLPRRSQSCLNVSPTSQYPLEPIYGRHVVGGVDNFPKFDYEREPSRRGQFASNHSNTSRSRLSSSLPRTSSSRSNSTAASRNEFSKRKNQQCMDYFESDEGYDDSMPRTTSWSPNSESKRTSSLDSSVRSRKSQNQQMSESAQLSRNSSHERRRFSSHENLLDSHHLPRLPSAASSRTLTNSKDATEEKLRTCLQVLDRLSAQVKEIKDVSKRVNYVDNKVKNGTLQQGERERRIRELNMAEAASRRLKNMIKTNVEDIPSTRLSSRSSGYESESSNGSRNSSSSPQQLELQRTSRPSGKTTKHLQVPDINRRYHDSQSYPHDAMPIWDSKTTESVSDQFNYRRTTREDSMSSGYATGSDDGRQNSPNVTNSASTISNYPTQRGNSQYHQKPYPNHQWNQQQYIHQQQMRQYQQESYDPYAIYGSLQHPAHNVDPQNQEIYGTYGELYNYAPSSVYDHDIYSNGWYQLPTANQETTPSSYGGSNQSHTMPIADAYNQGWSQMTSVIQSAPSQHAGLSDLFYDPTTQSNTTILENIAKEVAMGGENLEESTWKSYGSFRYRNGQRTVTTTGSANRKRKTVRFSQTVRQRVETEESEMEDSTSVIKGCKDELEHHTQNPSKSNNTTESDENADSSEIYMWPRQHPVQAVDVLQTTDQQQKPLPEPIYEFPSGHIESSCMCSDCILARGSCQMQPAQVVSYY